RALSRERLDPLLLGRAAAAGVEVLQPFTAREAREEGEEILVRAEPPGGGEARWLRAPIVLGAHGSWEPGPLPTQSARSSVRAGDLLGFKVHLLEVALAPDLMPLLAFEGGYGGMAACEGGRFSLSACIRRDALERARSGGLPAGEALLSHILERCPALRPALDGAVPEGPWLSAGPI